MKATLARWGKFNVVGLMGFAVQMCMLAVLHRLMPRHDLWAAAIALEVTLLHNFWWHVRYTWRDREGGPRVVQLMRFHLANGAVSMVGNLLAVRVLIQSAHWSLLAANAAAVVCCSAGNFLAGNKWAFVGAQSAFMFAALLCGCLNIQT